MSLVFLILNKFKNKDYLYVFILFLVFFAILLTNFPFGTWYTGWDNLHPEFNFWINIKRAIFAGWQENQGLGLMGGHGFAVTFPHSLLLLVLSLAIPLQYLRTVFTFLMLLIGSLGGFYFIKHFLKDKDITPRNTASLIGGIFYMLNFATVQNFYIQLEAFIVHFAALPWLLLGLLLLLEKTSTKRLLLFALTNFLATPQGFIPPLFVVYIAFTLIVLLVNILQKKTWRAVKTGFLVLVIILTVNAYWLLPLSYYTLTERSTYLNAYNNLLSTDNFISRNKEFGDLENVILLRGFLSKAIDIVESGDIFYIFQPWQQHFKNPAITYIGYFWGFLAVFGLGYAFFNFRLYLQIAFTLLFLVAFAALATDLPPFSYLHIFLQKIPVLKQAFRASFTKFSISFSLFYSLFFAVGIYSIGELVMNKKLLGNISHKISKILVITLIGTLLFYSLPTFKGHFLYARTKLDIPENYLSLFDFFSREGSNTRIANFPQGWHWGWSVYRWGYSGSGFLWYGIEQPILDRAFDVWSNYNENYYWELVYAVYSGNFAQFDNLLEKYQISWLVFDENFLPYPNYRSFIYSTELKNYLDTSPKVTLVKTLNSSRDKARPISIYKVHLETPVNNFVYLAQNLPTVGPIYQWNNYDKAFEDNGDFVSATSNWPLATSYYPFRSLFTGRSQQDLEFSVEDRGDYFSFKKTLPAGYENYSLQIPETDAHELISVDARDFSKTKIVSPDVYFDGKIIEVKVPKIGGYFGANINPANFNTCDNVTRGFLRLTLTENTSCTSFYLPNLPHDMSYLIIAQTKNISGRPILFWLENTNSRRADIETYLSRYTSEVSRRRNTTSEVSYFIQPPMEKDGVGYALHFDNVSIGKEKSTNQLGEINVYPMPFKFLTSLVLKKQLTTDLPSTRLTELDVSHPNPSLYKVAIEQFNNETISNSTLVLSQSHDKGWKAYKINVKCQMSNVKCFLSTTFPFLFGKEIKEHVLVNNWANGWTLTNYTLDAKPYTLVIVYLPQYLEYLGFFLLTLFAVFVMMSYAASKP